MRVRLQTETFDRNVFDMCVVVEELETLAFWVLDFQDYPSTAEPLSTSENFRGALVGQYLPRLVPKFFKSKAWLVEPGYYPPSFPQTVAAARPMVARLRANGPLERRAFWSGSISRCKEDQRDHIRELAYRYPKLVECYDGRLERVKFFEEAARYSLAIAASWGGSHSWREFEMFGLGIPVVSVIFEGRLAENLIPGMHYIGVPVETREDGKPADPDLACELMAEIIRCSIEDEELRLHVAGNALAWYERNCIPEIVVERAIEWIAGDRPS